MSFGKYGFRESKPVQPALPDGLTVERFATAMAAANGVSLMRCDEATAAQFRRSAQGALMVFGVDAPGLGMQLGAQRLSDLMDEARACLRFAVSVLDGDEGVLADEAWLRRLYRCGTAMETSAAAAGSIAPEVEETI